MSDFHINKKALLMGSAGSGKTSLRSIIFSNYTTKDPKKLESTIDVERSCLKMLGNLVLHIWDCGRQEEYLKENSKINKEVIFSNVDVLVYVFDMTKEREELQKDYMIYEICLNNLHYYSATAKIYILLHKMDLVQQDQKEKLIIDCKDDIVKLTKPMECTVFLTTIFNETLHQVWSSILHALIPSVEKFQRSLKKFADTIECKEVVVFERSTFLYISHYQRVDSHDAHCFERISKLLKLFQVRGRSVANKFESMQIRNSNFVAVIDQLTTHTYILVVASDPYNTPALISFNIESVRKHFENIELKFFEQEVQNNKNKDSAPITDSKDSDDIE